MKAGHPAKERHVLTGDSKVAAAHAPVAQQRRKNRDDRADRHGEAEPLAASNDGGVHADDARHRS